MSNRYSVMLLLLILFTGSVMANPVDDFVYTQKNFIIGMQSGIKHVFQQTTPNISGVHEYIEEQRTIANSAADVNSVAFTKGEFTGVLIPYITAVAAIVTQ